MRKELERGTMAVANVMGWCNTLQLARRGNRLTELYELDRCGDVAYIRFGTRLVNVINESFFINNYYIMGCHILKKIRDSIPW